MAPTYVRVRTYIRITTQLGQTKRGYLNGKTFSQATTLQRGEN